MVQNIYWWSHEFFSLLVCDHSKVWELLHIVMVAVWTSPFCVSSLLFYQFFYDEVSAFSSFHFLMLWKTRWAVVDPLYTILWLHFQVYFQFLLVPFASNSSFRNSFNGCILEYFHETRNHVCYFYPFWRLTWTLIIVIPECCSKYLT